MSVSLSKKPKHNEALELLWRHIVSLKPVNHEKLKKPIPVLSGLFTCVPVSSVMRPGRPLIPYSQFNQNDLSLS